MRYRTLGRTGLFVSELCLGTMTFAGGENRNAATDIVDQDRAEQLLRMALDAGITFIDTANVYADGRAEAMLGRAIRNLGLNRQSFVLASKASGIMGPDLNARGFSAYHILGAIEDSLTRLQLDHIDLYQIHSFDPATPIEEALKALDLLVRRGRVRYVGVSNWSAWQIMKALGISERLGLARFASLQAYYTLAGRDIEREIVPLLHSEGLGLMVWSPLAGGLLSGKYDRAAPAAGGGGSDAGDGDGGRRATLDFPPVDAARGWAAIDAMRPMAAARGCSVAQIAIAWLLHQPAVTTVIVGAKRPAQLADNIGTTRIALTADELATLDACSRLPREYPGWMIDRQTVNRMTPG